MSLRTPTFEPAELVGVYSVHPNVRKPQCATTRQYAGATYFFTLNAADRSGHLLTDHIDALRDSFRTVRRSRPFALNAICVLPDYLHLLMTLPSEDADFATRIMLIKQGFSRRVPHSERISASRASKGERGLWQRRYWEHLLRDDADFERHVDYIRFDPMKHGWATRGGLATLQHSSLYSRRGHRRFVGRRQ